jgi:hypothetical protein
VKGVRYRIAALSRSLLARRTVSRFGIQHQSIHVEDYSFDPVVRQIVAPFGFFYCRLILRQRKMLGENVKPCLGRVTKKELVFSQKNRS